MSLPDRFTAHLDTLQPPPGPALVAVSGGSDSVALLDLLSGFAPRYGLDLVVAHADHQINEGSAAAAEAVAGLAGRYRLPFEVGRLGLGPATSETAARAARYDWLAAVAQRRHAPAILTAHHADDQAETILMRLLAGSGPAGLAGMASHRGLILRPLLPFRREELAQYVHQRGLPVWHDPANTDPRHLRSWIRSSVLPPLAARVPNVGSNLRRTGRLAQEDRDAWEAALDAFSELDCRLGAGGISVAAPPLAGYDSALAGALIRAAARRAGFTVGERGVARVLSLARAGRSGRTAPLGGHCQAELSFGRVCFTRVSPSPVALEIGEAPGGSRWGTWALRWERAPAPARQSRQTMTAWFTPASLAVRPARSGDTIRPIRGNGSRPIVRCFQDARVPRSQRGAWPVFETDGSAVWIPGVCRADQLVPADGAEALRVDVSYS